MTDIEMDVSRDHGVEENLLPNGNKLAIFRVANTALYKVAHATSAKPLLMGEELEKVHGALLGMFTSPHSAQEALKSYLSGCWERVKKTENPSKPISATELNARSDKEQRARGA